MSSSWGAGRHKCAPPKTLVSLGFLQWREKRNRSRCELTVNSPRSPRSPSPLWWWITALRPTAGQQLCSFTAVVVVVFLKERWELPSFPSVFLSYVPSLFTSPFFFLPTSFLFPSLLSIVFFLQFLCLLPSSTQFLTPDSQDKWHGVWTMSSDCSVISGVKGQLRFYLFFLFPATFDSLGNDIFHRHNTLKDHWLW